MQQPDRPTEYQNNTREFARFIIVGFSNFAVSFAVFYLLYNYANLSAMFYDLLGEAGKTLADALEQFGAASLDATLANVVGYGAGIINSFTWNRLWTFKVRHKTAVQFGRFLVLNLSCLALSSASLFLFTDYLGWSYLPVWLVTMGIITLVNFGFSKFWVFQLPDK